MAAGRQHHLPGVLQTHRAGAAASATAVITTAAHLQTAQLAAQRHVLLLSPATEDLRCSDRASYKLGLVFTLK